jgi:hypothetical protein
MEDEEHSGDAAEQRHDERPLVAAVARTVADDDILRWWCDEQHAVGARLKTALAAAVAREGVEAGSMSDTASAAQRQAIPSEVVGRGPEDLQPPLEDKKR